MKLSELDSPADLEVETTARALVKLRAAGFIDVDRMTEYERAVFLAGVATGVSVMVDMIGEDNEDTTEGGNG